MNIQHSTGKTIWYREPYVWLLIFFPFSAIVGGIITTWLAVQSSDGLVVDDYYKRGLEINRTMERDRAAERHGLGAELLFEADADKARIHLKSDASYSPPDRIHIRFLHATRGGFDKEGYLNRIAPELYETDLPELIRGQWYILLEAENWRLLESFHIP
ncbi:MAG: FixH family protein [Gammaproteobacteria bacterium]